MIDLFDFEPFYVKRQLLEKFAISQKIFTCIRNDVEKQ